MGNGITWLEVEDSVDRLSPMEALRYYTELSSKRPAHEPWAAFLRSLQLHGEVYHSIGISLPAHYGFTRQLVADFSALAERLSSLFSDEERVTIMEYQHSQANAEQLWSASDRGLEIITPSRLTKELREGIEAIFNSSPNNIYPIPDEKH